MCVLSPKVKSLNRSLARQHKLWPRGQTNSKASFCNGTGRAPQLGTPVSWGHVPTGSLQLHLITEVGSTSTLFVSLLMSFSFFFLFLEKKKEMEREEGWAQGGREGGGKEEKKEERKREKQISLPFRHSSTTKSLVRSSKNSSAKRDSRVTTESALVSHFQKAAFSESIFNVVSVILRWKTFSPLPFSFGNLVTIVSVPC